MDWCLEEKGKKMTTKFAGDRAGSQLVIENSI